MKYSRAEIIQLIQMAFRGAEADRALKREMNITSSELAQSCALLMCPDVLSGLEILFNAVYPRAEELPTLLQVAEKYALEYLELSARPYPVLTKRGRLRNVADLLRLSDYQISSLRGIGPNSKSLEEIRRKRQKFINDYNNGLIR